MPRLRTSERLRAQAAELDIGQGTTVRRYVAEPTAIKFHKCNKRHRVLVGPFASGKTTMCATETFRRCKEQAPGRDGIRKSRWAVIRNTYPELKSTTIKSWLEWIPQGVFGEIVFDVPIVFYLQFEDVYAEIIFVSLDKPAHVRKLLSMNLTGAWINEAREVPQELIDAVDGRIGRYPDKDSWTDEKGVEHTVECTWEGILYDTNPPDRDHWIPEREKEVERLTKERASPELLELKRQLREEMAPEDREEIEAIEIDPDDWEFFHQPGGLEPNAENLANLKGGRQYYVKLARGKTIGFKQVFIDGKYGSAEKIAVVYPEFHEVATINGVEMPWHVSPTPLKPNPKAPLYCLFDYGRTPVCVLMQYLPWDQVVVLRELIATDYDPDGMSIRTFASTAVKWHLASHFANYRLLGTGDPSGAYSSQTTEDTCETILNEIFGADFMDSSGITQEVVARTTAVSDYLGLRMARNGQPAFLMDPSCTRLKAGFTKEYHRRRKKVEGRAQAQLEIVENHPYTDVHDALQAGMLRMKFENRMGGLYRGIAAQGGRLPVDDTGV